MTKKLSITTETERAKGIFTFFDVSTGHITESDDELIKADDFPIAVYGYDNGYFIHASGTLTESEDHLRAHGMSESFIKVWKRAVEMDCWYVRFDSDGMTYADFDHYEW